MPRNPRDKIRFYLAREPRKPNWYVKWSEGGKAKKFSTGTEDKPTAQRFLLRFEDEFNATPPEQRTLVKNILDDYLAFKKQDYAVKNQPERNHKELSLALTHIRPMFEHLYANQITRQLGRKYTDKRLELGRSTATIGKELSVLNAAINHAFREGVIDRPYTVKLPPPPPPRDRWMKEEEVKTFLPNLKSQHVYVFANLALHTLARKSAILELTWDRVDFQSLTIDLNVPGRGVTKKRRAVVPINGPLYECLAEAKDIAETDFVVEFNGKCVKDIKKGFANAAKDAGMEWVTPHILRHTGATLMAKHGVSLWQIAGMMADDIKTVTKHYAKHHPDYLIKASEALERLYK